MARTSALSKLVPRRGGAKAAAAPARRGPGRPPGSKNKAAAPARRGPGRPPGSKNKASAPARRGPGRPPGSKNKTAASGARRRVGKRIYNVPQQIRDMMRKSNPVKVRRKGFAAYMRIVRQTLNKKGYTLYHGVRRKYKSAESQKRAARRYKQKKPYFTLAPARIKKMQAARAKYLKQSPTAGRRVGNKLKKIYRPVGGKK